MYFMGVGEIVQLVRYVPGKRQAPRSVPRTHVKLERQRQVDFWGSLVACLAQLTSSKLMKDPVSKKKIEKLYRGCRTSEFVFCLSDMHTWVPICT